MVHWNPPVLQTEMRLGPLIKYLITQGSSHMDLWFLSVSEVLASGDWNSEKQFTRFQNPFFFKKKKIKDRYRDITSYVAQLQSHYLLSLVNKEYLIYATKVEMAYL